MSSPSRREALKSASLLAGGAIAASTLLPSPVEAGPRDDATLQRLTTALTDFVRHKFPSPELAGQIKAIEQDIQGNLQAAEALTRVPIHNADEPDFTFIPE